MHNVSSGVPHGGGDLKKTGMGGGGKEKSRVVLSHRVKKGRPRKGTNWDVSIKG